MFCLKCSEPISLLGLLDRKTNYEQYTCTKCGTVYLKTPISGLIFPKEEFRILPESK